MSEFFYDFGHNVIVSDVPSVRIELLQGLQETEGF